LRAVTRSGPSQREERAAQDDKKQIPRTFSLLRSCERLGMTRVWK